MEPVRILEEALARHRKKFAGSLGCIVVERDGPSLVERLRKPFPTVGHPAHPISPLGCRRKRRDTVDLTVEQVDSMGAFVDHHAPRPIAKPATLHHPRPRQHHAAAVPGLAQPRLLPLQFAPALQRRRPLHQIVARVDENRLQPVEELIGHPQHDQAGLSGDRQADLVVDLQAATTLEPFLGHEHRHPVPQPLPILSAKPLHLPHVAGEDVAPDWRPRPLPDRATSSRPQPAKHDDTRTADKHAIRGRP